MTRTTLPIDKHLPSIWHALSTHSIVVVEAPPGSGKTTRVAPYLLEQLQTRGDSSRIQLLQPRRLAARSVADRIASESKSQLGQRIGYQVRFDSQVSSQTQLVVSTEGILLRRLQDDPLIAETAIVLLDEFHERSLDADVVLGMLRRIQQTVRDDLKIVIMSATIDTEALQLKLASPAFDLTIGQESFAMAPVIKVDSPCFPVKIRFRPPNSAHVRPVDHMVETILDVVPRHEGDVLAFLPGAGEIHRVYQQLEKSTLARECKVVMLYGSMSLEEQSRAIETEARRKIILATNIAETSLTIEGVRVVIDSGLARVMRFSADVGLDRLSLENISQASAAQRAGRAGRVAPGVCYRLWSEASDRARSPFLEPEIARIDLASAMLKLFSWGEGSSQDFPWLDKPREESWQSARNLLRHLGAIDGDRITEIGNQMVKLPVHPRLARLLLESTRLGCPRRACLLAAMLSERDPFDRRESQGHQRSIPTRAVAKWDSDCVERLECLEAYLDRRNYNPFFGELNRTAVSNITSVANQLIEALASQTSQRLASEPDSNDSRVAIMRCLLKGYPDRVARRRGIGKSNGIMVGGKGVSLGRQSGVVEPEFFLCIDVDAGRGEAQVRQASRVERDWLNEGCFEREECFFHPSQKQVVARKQIVWLDLVLQETPTNITDAAQAKTILMQAVKQNWDATFPKEDEALVCFIERVNCLRNWVPELDLPQIDTNLLESVAEQLCDNARSLSQIRSGSWLDWLRSRFTPEQLVAIDREAPTRIEVPSGSSIRIQYEVGKPPILAVKIQEVFSLKATPRIARGRVPILFHLLSPAMRPQQVTDDLASFWANGYPELRKELKRRYPKHSWPDDPTTANPGRK